jgi:hypothetical protein
VNEHEHVARREVRGSGLSLRALASTN